MVFILKVVKIRYVDFNVTPVKNILLKCIVYMHCRDLWMNWWSLSILGKVDRTLITYLPDPESGIVSKLEIVELPDMFRRLQNSRVIVVCSYLILLN